MKHDEWRNDDVITDLDDDGGCSDNGVSSLNRSSYHPLRGSSVCLKLKNWSVTSSHLCVCVLSSGRKSDPCCCINDMSFEFLHFEALVDPPWHSKTHERKDSNVWVAITVETRLIYWVENGISGD